MPIPTQITDLSQTAASNYPSGSDSPSTLDDTQRAHASFIALLRDGKGLTNTATVASATTTDIGGQNSQFVEVTGTTTITSFGSTYNGPRYIRFQGALTLTHNATTLNIYGGASVTTSANYMVVAIPNVALNGWNVWPVAGASGSFAASGANIDITSLSGLVARGLRFASTNAIDIASAMPSTGSYVAGDIVFESTTGQRISGWKRITTGSGHVLNTDWAYFSASPQLGTAVATTSGTSIDFTGIPSWVKRITVMLQGVSTSGSNRFLVQGGSGSVQTTGYLSATSVVSTGVTTTASTAGFIVDLASASTVTHGSLTLSLQDSASNKWVASGVLMQSDTARTITTSGSVSFSGTIDRIRLTTVGGTDTFDAGSINILYE